MADCEEPGPEPRVQCLCLRFQVVLQPVSVGESQGILEKPNPFHSRMLFPGDVRWASVPFIIQRG